MGAQTPHQCDEAHHQALLYASEEEFVGGIVPYLLEGVLAGDHVLAVTAPDHIDVLRDRLPRRGNGVEFGDSTTWFTAPHRAIADCHAYVRRHERNGRGVRIICEPSWSDRTRLQRQAWQRFESLFNLAFTGRKVSAVCAYDSRACEPECLTAVRSTHPMLASTYGRRPSPDYVDPADFWAALAAEPLPEPADPVTELAFTADDLAAARALTKRQAERAGLPADRVAEVKLGVNEITTNAIEHGGGRGRLRSWREDHALVFEIHDSGDEAPGPLAGQLRPPSPDQHRGRGLWIASQICDHMELRHGPGWLVRIYVNL